ncbi:MAG: carboxymuconolactone decarboxylase family protein [Betaproteobacteria bacterium]|nr:carboxymuconolactone decarboxylase family protein [Betaproteobacteria bacterium]
MIKHKQRVAMRDLTQLNGEDADTAAKNRLGGRDLNIFRVMMNHPKLTRRWTVFAGHVLHKQTLPFRDRELLILRIGWLNQSEYEWAQHVEIAKRGGMAEEEIERIKRAPEADWNAHEAALLRAADELFENSVVSDQTWATLAQTYSIEQLMDVVFTIGQYNLVSWALNSFGVPLDDFLPGAKA